MHAQLFLPLTCDAIKHELLIPPQHLSTFSLFFLFFLFLLKENLSHSLFCCFPFYLYFCFYDLGASLKLHFVNSYHCLSISPFPKLCKSLHHKFKKNKTKKNQNKTKKTQPPLLLKNII